MSRTDAGTFHHELPFIPLHHTYAPFTSSPQFTSFHFTAFFGWFSSHLHFTLFITFLALFLKLFGLQEREPKASVASWFQSCMVLFTKEYFTIWNLFGRSNTEIVGSKPICGMDVCAFILCVGSGFTKSDAPAKESYRLRKWKGCEGPKGCRPMEKEKKIMKFRNIFFRLLLLLSQFQIFSAPNSQTRFNLCFWFNIVEPDEWYLYVTGEKG
jgi:hypothetical protein